MSKDQFTTPVIVSDTEVQPLERVQLGLTADQSGYDEAWVQDLVFQHPECLPITEIDASYSQLVPVCRELNTPAGPIDVLYATPEGRLVLLEAKLWRNPESRRKVVGQILDYAKELSRWDYEDLQREVSRATGRKGNALYGCVADVAEADEAQFVDEVSRSLKTGRFLLLVVGDGIREGVGAITEFLERYGTLQFTFGLVELAIYRMPDSSMLVQPRVLAQTAIIKRTVISIRDNTVQVEEDAEPDGREDERELSELERFYEPFWSDFLAELKLDDVSQPMAKVTRQGKIFFPMPPSGGTAWITVYFYQRRQEVGVFLTFIRGELADHLYQALSNDQASIDQEIGIPIVWESTDGKYKIADRLNVGDLRSDANRDQIKQFFADRINRFVNTFRPRLERIVDSM